MYPSRVKLAAKLALCEENSTGPTKISCNMVGNPNAKILIRWLGCIFMHVKGGF